MLLVVILMYYIVVVVCIGWDLFEKVVSVSDGVCDLCWQLYVSCLAGGYFTSVVQDLSEKPLFLMERVIYIGSSVCILSAACSYFCVCVLSCYCMWKICLRRHHFY